MHRQVESWTCTLNFRFIVFVKHVSMQAVIICTGIFSLQNTRKCMIFSNKFVSFIHRSHLYLTRKTLIVPDDVYPLGAIVNVCCAIKEWTNFLSFSEAVHWWLAHRWREADNDCSKHCSWRIRWNLHGFQG